MRSVYLLVLVLLGFAARAQQFRYDNVKYKTVFPEDLCKTLAENSGYTILDVRSDGEFYDTSSYSSLNIGRFKNVKHINISELAARWRELEDLKNKPLFIYCSHSQRSRRASRMLADSGFTKVFNINGGMTNIIMNHNQLPPCINEMYTTNLPYTILSPAQVMENAKKTNPYYIIDLRPDSLFNGQSSVEKRNIMGRLKGAQNILPGNLKDNLTKIPSGKPVLLVDEAGNDAPGAAILLSGLGQKNINIIFDGMDAWMDEEVNHGNNSVIKWESHTSYQIISADQFDGIMKKSLSVVIDIRSRDQFSNQSKNYWENIGQVKSAVNIPFTEIDKTASLPSSKDTPVILYTFNNQPEVFEAAKALANKGYKHVSILYGGIWNLRWAAHNLKGKSYLAQWVTGVPEQNL